MESLMGTQRRNVVPDLPFNLALQTEVTQPSSITSEAKQLPQMAPMEHKSRGPWLQRNLYTTEALRNTCPHIFFLYVQNRVPAKVIMPGMQQITLTVLLNFA